MTLGIMVPHMLGVYGTIYNDSWVGAVSLVVVTATFVTALGIAFFMSIRCFRTAELRYAGWTIWALLCTVPGTMLYWYLHLYLPAQ